MSTQGDKTADQPPVTEADETQKSIITLTEKGQELYEANKLKLSTKLSESWEKVKRFISEHAELSETSRGIDSDTIRQLQRDLNSLYADYRMCYGEYENLVTNWHNGQ